MLSSTEEFSPSLTGGGAFVAPNTLPPKLAYGSLVVTGATGVKEEPPNAAYGSLSAIILLLLLLD
jgi:hypothetical protein